jgi:hypothetical protein
LGDSRDELFDFESLQSRTRAHYRKCERSAGFLAIPDLARLASGDEMSVQTHQRYISQGTEWVAVEENQDLVGFLAAEIIARDLHMWERDRGDR